MKTYSTLEEIFHDKIFRPSDIVIFWGKRGFGKSSLESMLGVLFMQPRNAKKDVMLSKAKCNMVNEAGYNLIPPSDHLVFTDTWLHSVGPHLKNTWAYEFESSDFCLSTAKKKGGLLCPYGKYIFDEQSDKFDSHMGALAVSVSKAMELSRQMNFFVMIAMQRPMRLSIDIRDLATFVECIDIETIYNKYGRITAVIWTVNIIYSNTNLEQYLKSRDKDLVDKTIKFRANFNIYNCYDSEYYLPLFFKGHEGENFVLKKSHPVEYTPAGFQEFFERNKETSEERFVRRGDDGKRKTKD